MLVGPSMRASDRNRNVLCSRMWILGMVMVSGRGLRRFGTVSMLNDLSGMLVIPPNLAIPKREESKVGTLAST